MPPGASGSSTIKANVALPEGVFCHARGGERSAPSQVWARGILPLFWNAELVISIDQLSLVEAPSSSNAKNQNNSLKVRLAENFSGVLRQSSGRTAGYLVLYPSVRGEPSRTMNGIFM